MQILGNYQENVKKPQSQKHNNLNECYRYAKSEWQFSSYIC